MDQNGKHVFGQIVEAGFHDNVLFSLKCKGSPLRLFVDRAFDLKNLVGQVDFQISSDHPLFVDCQLQCHVGLGLIGVDNGKYTQGQPFYRFRVCILFRLFVFFFHKVAGDFGGLIVIFFLRGDVFVADGRSGAG